MVIDRSLHIHSIEFVEKIASTYFLVSLKRQLELNRLHIKRKLRNMNLTKMKSLYSVITRKLGIAISIAMMK